MTLREFLATMRHRWMTIAAATLVVLAATAAATLSIPPTYTASSRMFFSAEAPANDETGESGGVYVLTPTDLTTYIEVLGSPQVVAAIRDSIGLDPGVGFTVRAATAGTSSILDITATAGSAETAAAVANEAGPQLAAVALEFSPLLANNGQTVSATFISEASPPGRPSSPDVGRNLALGLLFGLVIGVGLAYVRHSLDTRVRDESDIADLSDRPVLAALPFDKGSLERPLVMESAPYSPHAEEFRRLRANLLFVDVATASHSVVVTSALPSEGKTTTAVNLAIAMADAGSRVLLVDADLRNPSVAKTMGLDGEQGLTTVLIGRATFVEVAQKWKDTSLWVLPAGQVPPNPSELLGSTAMERTFAELTEHFDYVLVDSPPVIPVIDALILNKLTGATLLVVSVDRIRKRFLAHALKALQTAGAHVSGFALNMVPVSGPNSYYGYGYGYHPYGSSPDGAAEVPPRKRRDVVREPQPVPEPTATEGQLDGTPQWVELPTRSRR